MNTFKILVCAFVSLFVVAPGFAQGWERIYPDINPGDGADIKKILPAPGGGYLLLVADQAAVANEGDFHLVKITENGVKEWVRNYDFGQAEYAEDFIATSDGGYALIYFTVEGPLGVVTQHLLKLDDQFNVVFNKLFPPQAFAWSAQGRVVLENGAGYWIFGSAYQSDGPTTAFVLGCDTDGADLGYFEWGTPNMWVWDAVGTPDGGFIVIADRQGNAPGQGGLISISGINASGNAVEWENVISDPADGYLGCRSIVAAPDGGYLISGARSSVPRLFKIDGQGNVLWQKNVVSPPGEALAIGSGALTPTAAGDGYWMTTTNDSYIPQIVLHRLDLNGNQLFQKLFGVFFAYNFSDDIVATGDGGCLFGGSRSIMPNSQQRVAFAVRTDNAGVSYTSGIGGHVSFDFDHDCIGDADTLLYGFNVIAWQNGGPVSAATIDTAGQYVLGLDPGAYQITMSKPNNAWDFCPDTIPVVVLAADTLTGVDFTATYLPEQIDSVYGSVFEDIDGDCIRDSFETGYPGWLLVATILDQGIAKSITAVTDADGRFSLPQTDLAGINNTATGFFSISSPTGDGLNCKVTCQDAFNIQFVNSNSYEANFGVHCDSLPPCPVIDVDIATAALRLCFDAVYTLNYCNTGAVTAENASVEVTIDSALQVTGASIPWSAVNGNTYTFDLGDLAAEQCGNLTISVFVPCDDPVGATYCVEAHAHPDTICAPAGANWDGSQIEVSATCTDTTVAFLITNTGVGDMLNPLEYIVIEDNVLLMQGGAFQLEASESQEVTYPANGSFYRLEADQAPGFPGLGMPVAWVEGCGGNNVSLGFVNQYPLGDDDPWIDVFCLESVNSFDPNDKQGFPRGYGNNYYLEQNTDIEYMIRFQNTGTAPAFTVEIRDTIPVQWLDPSTVRPGASSHAYEWDMQGNGVVVFRFPDINLPDSNANWLASQGFVKFRVSQRKDNPIGTKIENRAGIYFDFNAPVITNQTLHTIGKDFITVGTDAPWRPDVRVYLAPNPASQSVRITLTGANDPGIQTMTVFNSLGAPVLQEQFAGSTADIQVGHLPGGVYFFEVRSGKAVLATGKMVR